ncbi:MAG: type II toxin-antitoxin system VapC family toxin [Lentisphaerae bacterium]|nr:type II toxin-antitoxin system VapC family toxin [Lentisphaerota bacterium]
MIGILDTHSFLWSVFTPRRLSLKASQAIVNSENEIVVSLVSFWEIALKYALGKIELTGIAPDDLPGLAQRMGFDLLALDAADAASFHRLPRLGHNDPFDRMLVHQAVRRHATLISCDSFMSVYAKHGLTLLW